MSLDIQNNVGPVNTINKELSLKESDAIKYNNSITIFRHVTDIAREYVQIPLDFVRSFYPGSDINPKELQAELGFRLHWGCPEGEQTENIMSYLNFGAIPVHDNNLRALWESTTLLLAGKSDLLKYGNELLKCSKELFSSPEVRQQTIYLMKEGLAKMAEKNYLTKEQYQAALKYLMEPLEEINDAVQIASKLNQISKIPKHIYDILTFNTGPAIVDSSYIENDDQSSSEENLNSPTGTCESTGTSVVFQLKGRVKPGPDVTIYGGRQIPSINGDQCFHIDATNYNKHSKRPEIRLSYNSLEGADQQLDVTIKNKPGYNFDPFLGSEKCKDVYPDRDSTHYGFHSKTYQHAPRAVKNRGMSKTICISEEKTAKGINVLAYIPDAFGEMKNHHPDFNEPYKGKISSGA